MPLIPHITMPGTGPLRVQKRALGLIKPTLYTTVSEEAPAIARVK